MTSGATIERVRLRGVLDSRGVPTVEAEVEVDGGGCGRASAPQAIAPGERERRGSTIRRLGPQYGDPTVDELCGLLERRRFGGQVSLDRLLDELPPTTTLGADVRMAISVAFCRARLARGSGGSSLVSELAGLAGTKPAMPRLLVNIFSGGIHDPVGVLPFQQLMLIPELGSLSDDVRAALAVYGDIERRLAATGPLAYSQSSGMIAPGLSVEELLDTLVAAIDRHMPSGDMASLGVDVAAEHLADADGNYRVGVEQVDGPTLLERHRALLASYPIAFFEDPFAPDDEALWRELRRDRPERTSVFGDDFFATDALLVDESLADGLVIKVSQIGSLGAALAAARRAIDLNMMLCVSHRSGETEDHLICDLAVALGARFLKLGGPRRGDRTARYNEMLRLSELWEQDVQTLNEGRRT